jgi:hypothetical protein
VQVKLGLLVRNRVVQVLEARRQAIDQPTIIREYTSSIAQQCTVPSLVQCSVMSVTHNVFGRSATNRRCTRSSWIAGLDF